MEDHIGKRLGNYRLTRLLGSGGFAEVYLGEHIFLKTYTAIKLLLTRLSSDDNVPIWDDLSKQYLVRV